MSSRTGRQQVARNVSGFDGELAGAKYLIHDRDSKFIPFDAVPPGSVNIIKLPSRSPDLNAFAERFVLSIKSECLNHFIPLGERFLQHTIWEYLGHYHAERDHQGLGIDNELLVPDERMDPTRQGVFANDRDYQGDALTPAYQSLLCPLPAWCQTHERRRAQRSSDVNGVFSM